jgi:hypothetical protein
LHTSISKLTPPWVQATRYTSGCEYAIASVSSTRFSSPMITMGSLVLVFDAEKVKRSERGLGAAIGLTNGAAVPGEGRLLTGTPVGAVASLSEPREMELRDNRRRREPKKLPDVDPAAVAAAAAEAVLLPLLELRPSFPDVTAFAAAETAAK